MISTSDIAGRCDFVCRRGDTFTRNLTFTTNGTTPQSFAGCSFAMKIVNSLGVVVFTIIPTIAGNVVTISETAFAMQVSAGNYYYDLQLTNADSTTVTMMQGYFTINKDVTA